VIISPAIVAVVMAAGAVAGGLGALLGIGGGVFLVPFLQMALALDWNTARGISLMTVIATSSVVAARASSRPLINLRLAMLLLIPAAGGGLLGAITVGYLPESLLTAIFAVITAVISLTMLARLDRRNVILDTAADPGRLGGRFRDDDTGAEVVYRVRRLPFATMVSIVGGYVSGIIGIGGGILQVPALNSWCGVPIRAAAATSAVMIGVTAASSAPIYFGRGHIHAPLAAAAIIGVLAGSQFGFYLGDRARVKWLKVLMAAVLALVSLMYFRRVL
jgi:uncharacterized protein